MSYCTLYLHFGSLSPPVIVWRRAPWPVRSSKTRHTGSHSLRSSQHKAEPLSHMSPIETIGSRPNEGKLSSSCSREWALKKPRRRLMSPSFPLTTLCLPVSPDGCRTSARLLQPNSQSCSAFRHRKL